MTLKRFIFLYSPSRVSPSRRAVSVRWPRSPIERGADQPRLDARERVAQRARPRVLERPRPPRGGGSPRGEVEVLLRERGAGLREHERCAIAFSSSRTLPGQRCAQQRRRAARESGSAGLAVARGRAARGSAAASAMHVLGPLAQRRDPDREHVQPVEEVLAETARARPRARRSRCVAAITRTSTSRVARAADAARIARSWSTRSSLAWSARWCPPTSSRNSVPPSAPLRTGRAGRARRR